MADSIFSFIHSIVKNNPEIINVHFYEQTNGGRNSAFIDIGKKDMHELKKFAKANIMDNSFCWHKGKITILYAGNLSFKILHGINTKMVFEYDRRINYHFDEHGVTFHNTFFDKEYDAVKTKQYAILRYKYPHRYEIIDVDVNTMRIIARGFKKMKMLLGVSEIISPHTAKTSRRLRKYIIDDISVEFRA